MPGTMATATLPIRESQAVSSLAQRYRIVRSHTERLCQPLKVEDYVVSSMPDVSPTKWHLAHTSWFFETFVLAPSYVGYKSPNPKYGFLFNSYYVQAGERHCRAQRGLITRPTVKQVFAYRRHVDDHMLRILEKLGDDVEHPIVATIELGLQHEQQHQELLLTDIKHVFFTNPLRPAYMAGATSNIPGQQQLVHGWREIGEGIHHIGHGTQDFSFDNERPRHRVFLEPFRIATRLVTNGEFKQFIDDGGYRRPELWLAAGWEINQREKRASPLYWEFSPDGWSEFTLAGMEPLDDNTPVCHVSYYEADAYARWAGARLPTEAEWEVAATEPVQGMAQLYGRRWQWTNSAYVAYPGYKAPEGAIGEYNGKWMSDQWVLRGSSSATPPGHERITYRNFFPSDTRWQFSGIRLAAS
jgi:ergothioneine biosynthesis protein EgtB